VAMTRREFVGSAGAALIGVGLAGSSGCTTTRQASETGSFTEDGAGEVAYGGKVVRSQTMPRPEIVLPTDSLPKPTGPKKRLALLGTLWAKYTHPDNIGTPFIEGYSIIGRNHEPHAEVASIFTDQVHAMDIGEGMAKRNRIPRYKTIPEALTMGTGKLAVDGVLLVCENGAYPYNDKKQKLWPRREWFEQVVKVFRDSARSVPVYNDKFFASTWQDSEWMYRQSKELGFPMAAGSSVPVAWRLPALAFQSGIQLDHALAVGYGHLEGYGYHTLELLQSFVEKRKGGVVGIKSVEVLEGDAAWRAAKDRRWREDVLRAVLARTPLEVDHLPASLQDADPKAIVILLEYADGFKSTAYMSRGMVNAFAFGAAVKGRRRPVATWAYLNKPQRDHFKFLCNHIEVLMRTGKPSIPVERTYLTTGAILAAVDSHYYRKRIETPHLASLTYDPPLW